MIELLIVIAIILILAAILFPVFLRAREKARSLSCLSNQKQLALACISYAADYDDTFMRYDSGSQTDFDGTGFTLFPYVKDVKVYRCPSAIGALINPAYNIADPGNWPNSYSFNAALCVGAKPDPRTDRLPEWLSAMYDANGSAQGVRMSSITRPSMTICVTEGLQDQPVNTSRRLYWSSADGWLSDEPYIRSTGAVWATPNVRHNWGGNWAFCDGHAEYFPWPQGYHISTTLYWVTMKGKSYAWWKIHENQYDPGPVTGNE